MNSSGKVMTIFLVIMAILLVSLTAISIFIFQKEKEKRIEVEGSLKRNQDDVIKFKAEIREIKRKNFLLQEKNKEGDEKINSLLDELELEKGLREEVRQENGVLKEKAEEAAGTNKKLQEELAKNLEKSRKKFLDLEGKFKGEISKAKEIKKANEDLKKINKDLKSRNVQLEAEVKTAKEARKTPEVEKNVDIATKSVVEKSTPLVNKNKNGVELDPIVVVPAELKEEKMIKTSRMEKKLKSESVMPSSVDLPEGKILSIDRETEFVIINIGKKDGIGIGQIMSVYRKGEYIGDIKVTRIQSEMSAADFILPLSSHIVQKNDQVMAK